MTEAILLSGKRGSGKSLSAVKMAQRYLKQGRIVATNLDLFLEKLVFPNSKAVSYRLPDIPTPEALYSLPVGNPDPKNEDMNGLLILDETAGYLNSREWKGADRTQLIHWLAQSRKFGWDLVLIAQGPDMIDKQIRNDICDVHGSCRSTDKIGIPFLTWLFWHFFEKKITMPKVHIASFHYGFARNSPSYYSDWFKGTDVREGYDTLQKISGEFGQQAISCNLSAWHLKGRYMSRYQMYGKIILTALVLGVVFGFGGGVLFGKFTGNSRTDPVNIQAHESIKINENIFVIGTIKKDGMDYVMLSNGRISQPSSYKFNLEGRFYMIGKDWYQEKI